MFLAGVARVITRRSDFKSLKVILKEGVVNMPPTPSIPAVTLNYGMFINTVIDFVIVAFCIFLVVKGLNSLKKSK